MNIFHRFLPVLLPLLSAPLIAQTVGPSTNMVSGTQWPGGDPYLQRQNEPSMAVSSRNPLHLLGGANDYRTVDIPFTAPQETGDAWLGIFKSFDGGQTWTSYLIPGYPQDTSPQASASPITGRNAAADPTVRAGTNGMFYYSGLAFDRSGNTSEIFLTRFIDDNNLEGGDTIRYLDTTVIANGGNGHFLDKPVVAVDIPRPGAKTCTIPAGPNAPAQSFPAGRIFVAYTDFVGGEGSSNAQIKLTQSSDCGKTWTSPAIVSKSEKTSQGAALAINPLTGDLYIAWRVFASPSSKSDGIDLAVQPAGAGSPAVISSPATRVANFTPFDQGTTNLSFRTNAYPAIAIDGTGQVYVTWSQRGTGPQGDARLVLVSGKTSGQCSGGPLSIRFGPQVVMDPNGARGHQIMPALAFSSGKLTATWYDFRDDDEIGLYTPVGGGLYSFSLVPDGLVVFDTYVQDPAPPYAADSRRHTVEVRAAQALPSATVAFGPSVTVSEYAYGTAEGDTSGEVEQLEFNPPNLPLFQQGTVPFFGDYIDIAGPTFIATGNAWRFNTQATDPDYTRIVWTDNRNVVQPADGDWTHYTPVASTGGPSVFDPTQQKPSCVVGQTGMRNQDIYTAALTPGVVLGAKGNRKSLSPTLQREFAVTVQNPTPQTMSYRLSILTQPVGGVASFLQFAQSNTPPLTQLDISIAPLSSAARSVFITSSDPNATVPVSAQQITAPSGTVVAGGLTSSITLNTDLSNPNISNPNISNTEIYNPNISNPNISNPNISNPNISNPNISNPNISNITFANPNISNPNISNPNISNPNISNPNISNPNISNPNISNTALTDVSYTVSNAGNTASAYTVNLLQNQQIPPGVTVQLIVSGIYTTPVANGCNLAVQAEYVPILNQTAVTFTDPSSLGLSSIPDPSAPTFALLPGEKAMVTIRAYDSTTSDPAVALQHYNPATAITPVASSQAANTGTNQPPVTLTVTTPSLAPATAGGLYSQTLSAIGGSGQGYVWAPAGPLPSSLNLTGAGVLQGTPTLAGTYPVAVQVTDSQSNTAVKTLTLVVNPAPAITTVALNAAEQNLAFSQQLAATGGTGPLAWSATGLPAGLMLTGAGLVSGTPTVAGPYSITVTVADANAVSASQTYSLVVAAPLAVATPSIGNPEQGVAYNVALTTTGGSGSLAWSTPTPAGLPPGLSVTNAGVIAGTPAASGGPFSFIVIVTDSLGAMAKQTYSVSVVPALSITPATLSQATINRPVSTTLTTSGGTSQVTWSLGSGSLPYGVTLSGAGVLSGTPTVTGSFPFTAKATDGAGGIATLPLTLVVNAAPAVTTNSLNAAEQGVAFSQQLTATGGTAPLAWSATVPAGLMLSASGLLSGNPSAAGANSVVATVTDANGATSSQTLQWTILAPLMIMSAAVPGAEQGAAYLVALTTSGGAGGLGWSISGSLPAGLGFNAGTISGSPQVAGGPFGFTVTATDSLGAVVTHAYSLLVIPAPVISPVTIPQATAGTAITPINFAVTGGTPGFIWTISNGALPNGVSLNPAGVLAGTPAAPGAYNFTVAVTDLLGVSATLNLSMMVVPAATPIEITTGPLAGFVNYAYPATLLAATGGTPPYTWSVSGIPGMNVTPDGVLTGFPTAAGTGTITVTDSAAATGTASFVIAPPTTTLVGGAANDSITTISNVSLTSGGNVVQISAVPGAGVPVSFNYNLVEGVSYCPSCIDQITVGFVGTNPTSCQYNGIPGPGGTGTHSASLTLTAPATPSRYYVAFHKSQQYTCQAATTFVISASDPVIGVVDVIPNAVTYQNIVLEDISTTPPLVSLSAPPPHQVTATFEWDGSFCNGVPCSIGTLAVGFNTDAAPQTCGGLNAGVSSPSYNVPNLPGRYYLSIDNVDSCAPPNHWTHGVPGEDFSRFIGVVNVVP
jgi:hypothetical protein